MHKYDARFHSQHCYMLGNVEKPHLVKYVTPSRRERSLLSGTSGLSIRQYLVSQGGLS